MGRGMLRSSGGAIDGSGMLNVNLRQPLSSASTVVSNASSISGTETSSGSCNLTIFSSETQLILPIAADSENNTSMLGWSPPLCDDFDWVQVEGSEEEDDGGGYFDRPPSFNEVQVAVSALQRVCDATPCSLSEEDHSEDDLFSDTAEEASSPTQVSRRVSRALSDLDWREPPTSLFTSRILPPYQLDHIFDAFHLLQTEPAVQRIVMALSSDKAVWEAVMNNEAVREIRKSYFAGESNSKNSLSDDSNSTTRFIRWVLESTKAKVFELTEKITNFVVELFKAPDDERLIGEITFPSDRKLQVSVLLTILVLLLVVVTRRSRPQRASTK